MDKSANKANSTIVKNAVVLYFRMFFTMVVGLYSSRVVLQNLGVDDFGLYGVVGGIVGMFGFLNVAMVGATQRFLTYDLGKGDYLQLNKTFNSALLVHVLIAFIVVLIAEPFGLWFLNNKLVIDESRVCAAYWVFHLSVLSAFINICQVPFTAVISAHEHFDVYAYVEMLNVTLKLLIVLILPYLIYDKLISYSILLFVVSTLIAVLYITYSHFKFTETKIHIALNKDKLKQMLNFSGWDLYGNMGARIYNQGTAMLLNTFFGAALNAASSLATTIQGVVWGFSGNVVTAFRPQLIKSYAQNNLSRMSELFETAVIFSSVLLLLIVTPLVAELPYVLQLWLGTVPTYAAEICSVFLYTAIINQIQITTNILIHASGKVKGLSLFNGSIFIFSTFVAYLLFKYTSSVMPVYYFYFFVQILILFNEFRLLRVLIPKLSLTKFLIKLITHILLVGFISYLSVYVLHCFLEDQSFFRLVFSSLLSSFVILFYTYLFLLTKNQKMILYNKLKQFVLR